MTRPGGVWQNWGRTASVRPQFVESPKSAGAVQRAVQSASRRGLRVKAVGAGHSFSDIAVSPGVMLDLSGLAGLIEVDVARSRVRVLAGTRLHQIPALLAPYALAMPNLGDIDRQSISGAISTGTHGTGARLGGISTQVVAATLVTADGELLRVGEDAVGALNNVDLLPAVALGLGALGILVDVTLQCVPAFTLHAIDRPAPLGDVLADLHERVRDADHFEFYWFPHTDVGLTKTNHRLPESAARRPLPRLSRWVDETLLSNGVYRVVCATGTALPGVVPALNRVAVRLTGDREYTDASARVFVQSRTVRFREMEYALPAQSVVTAFEELRALIARRRWRISFPVEVRFAAGDDRWLSSAYGRDTAYIAVHRYHRENPAEYFGAVEQIMLAHGGRPHWGKMHTLDADRLRGLYPRFGDFVALRDRLDPGRMFQNRYLERVLGS